MFNQVEEYLKLICKSTMVYGSSNNMELGLHILSYHGDIKRAIKPFLDNTIELPKDHPISNYKYPGKVPGPRRRLLCSSWIEHEI